MINTVLSIFIIVLIIYLIFDMIYRLFTIYLDRASNREFPTIIQDISIHRIFYNELVLRIDTVMLAGSIYIFILIA